jgi:hypothetical protein
MKANGVPIVWVKISENFFIAGGNKGKLALKRTYFD